MRTTSSWTLLLDSRSDITILSGMRSFVRAIRATSHTKIEGLWLLHFKLSLVEKAEPAQVCFTLHLRDQRSKWMQDGYKRLHEYKFIAVAINWGRGHLWLHTTWFWKCLGRAFGHFIEALTISWSLLLACVWSGPHNITMEYPNLVQIQTSYESPCTRLGHPMVICFMPTWTITHFLMMSWPKQTRNNVFRTFYLLLVNTFKSWNVNTSKLKLIYA